MATKPFSCPHVYHGRVPAMLWARARGKGRYIRWLGGLCEQCACVPAIRLEWATLQVFDVVNTEVEICAYGIATGVVREVEERVRLATRAKRGKATRPELRALEGAAATVEREYGRFFFMGGGDADRED